MRAHKPGGRFDADFETDSILIGFNEDYQRPKVCHGPNASGQASPGPSGQACICPDPSGQASPGPSASC